MLAIALNALKHATHFVRGGAVDMIKDELGITENGIERRAQLVAHVGKELRLVLTRRTRPYGSCRLVVHGVLFVAHERRQAP